MGLSSILDPLDLGGTQAAERTLNSARSNADLLRRFSDQSQANLEPFLEVGSGQLPALEAGASIGGFFNDANALRSTVDELAAPAIAEETENLNAQLGATGLTRSGAAIEGAADIQQNETIQALLKLQSMLNSRRQAVTGSSAGTGSNLANLNFNSATNIGRIGSEGVLNAQDIKAAGQQNILGLAGLGSEFITPRS